MFAVNNYVIVRKDHTAAEVHGIILPFERKLEKNGIGEPFTGVIESKGDMVTLVSENDHVVFYDLAQPWIIEDGQDLILVMKESDIIGILKDEQ